MEVVMKRVSILLLVVCTCFAVTAWSQASSQGGNKIITFDAPGAGMNSGQGTVPESINSNGEITGQYYDENDVVHGFLRAADGTVTTFDVPGASTGVGQGTYPYSVNSRGEITGWFYRETAGTLGTHGFVRDAGGVITMFDGGPNSGTVPLSINSRGEITGAYSNEGFVRAPDGTITTFAASQSTTVPESINSKGEITGWYDD